MTITAKYPGTCARCGGPIVPGQRIEWVRGRSPYHTNCPTEDAAIAAAFDSAPFKATFTHQAPQVGEAFRDRKYGIVTVVAVRKHYVTAAEARRREEDFDDFGAEPGWEYYVAARPATEQEAAPVLAAEAAAAARREARAVVDAIRLRIQREGERPEGWQTVEGEHILDTRNIYGGGDWFVVGTSHVWYVRNNGADGDDWSRNNVVTGGAGAIGWRIPRDEELVAQLLAAAELLSEEPR